MAMRMVAKTVGKRSASFHHRRPTIIKTAPIAATVAARRTNSGWSAVFVRKFSLMTRLELNLSYAISNNAMQPEPCGVYVSPMSIR
jgi:hypothetical protein